jgi:hypothetical protein
VNYGWPKATYGLEYNGQKMAGATPHLEGTEEPVYFWSPVIAPSGAQFYDGAAFPAWRGSLFIGGLASMRLVRLEVKDGKVTGEEHLLTDRKQRIRDVRQGRDGALYVVIDAVSGELWRIAPVKTIGASASWSTSQSMAVSSRVSVPWVTTTPVPRRAVSLALRQISSWSARLRWALGTLITVSALRPSMSTLPGTEASRASASRSGEAPDSPVIEIVPPATSTDTDRGRGIARESESMKRTLP